MGMPSLNFITSNPNKLREVKAILGDAVDLTSQRLDLTEVQGSIEEISRDKCRRAAAMVKARFSSFPLAPSSPPGLLSVQCANKELSWALGAFRTDAI